MRIIFYTIGCPSCKVLKTKLDEAKIGYTICSEEEEIKKEGVSIPSLKIIINEYDIVYLDFLKSIKWINGGCR